MKNHIFIPGPYSIQGRYSPPGDKSISHRAVMFGALASGTSRFSHFLEAQDCLHTLQAFTQMGVKSEFEPGSGEVVIHGGGLHQLQLASSSREIYLGNSGTSMRLFLGILAGQRMDVTLTGDPSLSLRPMKRVTEPLKKMGAQIKAKDNGNFAPLTIRGGKLKAIEYHNQLGSAQVKSAILLAGLQAEGETVVWDDQPCRDHTERFLISCGSHFQKNETRLSIQYTERLKPFECEIPGDISSAAFFIVAAAMIPGSELTVEKVGLNPTRTGILTVLKRMGAKIEVEVEKSLPEPIGTIHVQSAPLKGTRIVKNEIPALIDELPILMIAMALAEGESLISGAEELRVKETDRIHSMVTNLKSVGAEIEELPDGCLIRGVEKLSGGRIDSFGDHRTAMSFAIAAAVSEKGIQIDDIDCIATSFPSFFDALEQLTIR